jgi:hypothetical protein
MKRKKRPESPKPAKSIRDMTAAEMGQLKTDMDYIIQQFMKRIGIEDASFTLTIFQFNVCPECHQPHKLEIYFTTNCKDNPRQMIAAQNVMTHRINFHYDPDEPKSFTEAIDVDIDSY